MTNGLEIEANGKYKNPRYKFIKGSGIYDLYMRIDRKTKKLWSKIGEPTKSQRIFRVLQITQNDRMVQFASISFDASVYEFTMALLSERLFMVPVDIINDFNKF